MKGTSGLVGILLPEFPASKGYYDCSYLPGRLRDNYESGFAKLYTWSEFEVDFDRIIQEAFDNRKRLASRVDNSRLQMKRNQ